MARAESKFSPKAGIESKMKARLEALRNKSKKNPQMPNASLSDYVYSDMPDNGIWKRRHYGDYRYAGKNGEDRSGGIVGVEEYFFKDPETGEFVRELPIDDKALIARYSNMTDRDLDKLKRVRASMIMPIPYYNEKLGQWRYQLPLANTTPLPRMKSQLSLPFDGTMADYYEAWQKLIKDDPSASITKIPAEAFREPMYRQQLIDGNGNLITNNLAYDDYGNFRDGYVDDILAYESERELNRGDAGTMLDDSDLDLVNAAKITKKLYDIGIPLKFIGGINDIKDKQKLLSILNKTKNNIDIVDAINKNAVRNGFNNDSYLEKTAEAIEAEVKNKLYEELVGQGFSDDDINEYFNDIDIADFIDSTLTEDDIDKIKNKVEKENGLLQYLNLDELADELLDIDENRRLSEELNRQRINKEKTDAAIDKFYERTKNQKTRKVDNVEKIRLVNDLKALYTRGSELDIPENATLEDLEALEDKIFDEAKFDRKTRQLVYTAEQIEQLDKIAEAKEILEMKSAVSDKISSMPDLVSNENSMSGGWSSVKKADSDEQEIETKTKKQISSNELFDLFEIASKTKEAINNEKDENEKARLTELYEKAMSRYEAAKNEYDSNNQDIDNDGVVTDDDKKTEEDDTQRNIIDTISSISNIEEPEPEPKVFVANNAVKKNNRPSQDYLDRLSHIRKSLGEKKKAQPPNYTNKLTKHMDDGSNDKNAVLLSTPSKKSDDTQMEKNETFAKIRDDIDEANTRPDTDKKKRIVVLKKKIADKNKTNSSENKVDDIRREANKSIAKTINKSGDDELINVVDTNNDEYVSQEEVQALLDRYDGFFGED